MTSIKAAAGSLRDPGLRLSESDRVELAATVEESADRLTALVDNLLDSSRLAAGAVVPRPRRSATTRWRRWPWPVSTVPAGYRWRSTSRCPTCRRRVGHPGRRGRSRGVGVNRVLVVDDDAQITADLAAKKVVRGGTEVHLTPTEWGILEQLVRNRGRLVGQRQLLHEVWGPSYGKETNYLRVYLAQPRRKLEPDPGHPRHLITEPGMGYRFEA